MISDYSLFINFFFNSLKKLDYSLFFRISLFTIHYFFDSLFTIHYKKGPLFTNHYGTVSGSGTGPLDYEATGPVPDTEPRL